MPFRQICKLFHKAGKTMQGNMCQNAQSKGFVSFICHYKSMLEISSKTINAQEKYSYLEKIPPIPPFRICSVLYQKFWLFIYTLNYK